MTGRGEFSFYVFIIFCIALLSSFLCHLVRFLHPFIEFYLYPRMTVVLGNNTRLIPPRSFKVTSDSDIVSMLIREELGFSSEGRFVQVECANLRRLYDFRIAKIYRPSNS